MKAWVCSSFPVWGECILPAPVSAWGDLGKDTEAAFSHLSRRDSHRAPESRLVNTHAWTSSGPLVSKPPAPGRRLFPPGKMSEAMSLPRASERWGRRRAWKTRVSLCRKDNLRPSLLILGAFSFAKIQEVTRNQRTTRLVQNVTMEEVGNQRPVTSHLSSSCKQADSWRSAAPY